MKKLIVLLGVVAFVATSCGGREEAEAPAEGGSPTVAAGQVPFDRAFIDAMVPHHEAAIDMAREAKEAGLSEPDLVDIAENIIATQQSEIDQMLAWRRQWFGSSEPGPEEAALATLGMSAAEAGMEAHGMDLSMAAVVDQAFAETMIAHHEGAIRMSRLAKQRAAHQELRSVAADIIAAQEHEVGVMEKYAEAMH
jgi:uncharacterized protein (DUF305 family)